MSCFYFVGKVPCERSIAIKWREIIWASISGVPSRNEDLVAFEITITFPNDIFFFVCKFRMAFSFKGLCCG